MTLEQIRCLVALDEHRNFTKAAEHVYLSQPALSFQIRRLEEELGVVLFDRSKRPLEPTEAGRVAVAQARLILEEATRLKELLRGNATVFQGRYRLGAIPTLGPYLLPRVLPLFQEQHPALRIQVSELVTPTILSLLRQGELDASLIASDELEENLERQPLWQEAFVAYVSPRHPLYRENQLWPQQLPLAQTWILAEGHCFREQVLQVCQPNTGPRSLEFQSGSLDTLVRLVDTLGGLTLLPTSALWCLSEEQRAHLRPFLPPAPHRQIYLVWRQGSLRYPVTQKLGHILLQCQPG